MSTISLCTFVNDELQALKNMLTSYIVEDADEVIIVYTNPSWESFNKFKEKIISFISDFTTKYSCTRIYHVGFSSFGEMRTLTAHLATKEWVFMLDADEACGFMKKDLNSLIKLHPEENAFAFPRKRWTDLDMRVQVEKEAYPDFQVRLFKNNKDYRFCRELHEYFDGCAVQNVDSENLVIHHFHDVFKSPLQLAERHKLYSSLSIPAKVTIEGGKEIINESSLFE